MRDLLRHLAVILEPRARRDLALAVLGSVVVATLDALALALVLPLVELATDRDTDSSVVAWVSGLLGDPSRTTVTVVLTATVVGLFVLKGLGAMAFTWWLGGFTYAERVRTSTRVFRHLLTLPYGELSRRSSAELMRTTEAAVMQVFTFTVRGLIATIANTLAVLGILVTLVVVAPVPTLALVAYFAAAALLIRRVTKRRAAALGEVILASSLAGFQATFAAYGAAKELKLRGTQEHFVDRSRTAQMRGAYAGRAADFLAVLPRYLLEILFIVAIGVVVLASGDQGSSVGLLALFVAAGFRLLPSATAVLAASSGIRIGAESLRLVAEELADEHTGPRPPAGPPVPFERELHVEDVTFRYDADGPAVLDGIDLRVPFGSSVALVGSSGAGKTTLVDLVLGLHRPSAGRLLVDGVDVADRLPAWRADCAHVPQEIFLLDASLLENVAFDQEREDIDVAAARRALEVAQLGDLVAALPAGLDSPVGENGALLSGGQRQRVGIARALYREPRLLVLDEATSALDNETEHRISQVIASLHGQVTVVVVAHRLSTVRHADVVVYVDAGRIVDAGSFDDLAARVPGFARLVELGSLQPGR